ncbi:MAG: hypothetical protein K8L99_13465 [Anaerolineae bacterium]|nr:hypothetical protein [Anaerolineae bacterium]
MNINHILLHQRAPKAADRAVDAWNRIQDKPNSINVRRISSSSSKTTLAAQTVRIEVDNTAMDAPATDSAQSGKQRLVIFGVRGHCSIANTDLQQGDTFKYNERSWRVIAVNLENLGELQAMAEVTA